jgi:hypothetical protein
MTDKERDDLQDVELLLHRQHDDGLISDDDYHKCLVSLSYEYFLGDDSATGLTLLSLCDHRYFRDTQLQQVRTDPLYSKMVVFIAGCLIKKGIVSLYEVPAPTQAPAKA